MVCNVTSKNVVISDLLIKDLRKHINKIIRFLSLFELESANFTIVISKKGARGFFSGSIKLNLPSKSVYSTFENNNLEAGLKESFEKIYKEIKKYKALHNPGSSEFYSQKTIRRGHEIIIKSLNKE